MSLGRSQVLACLLGIASAGLVACGSDVPAEGVPPVRADAGVVADASSSPDATPLMRADAGDGAFADAGAPDAEPAPDPVCGNGVIEAGELCDGAALAGASCEGLGYAGGALVCRGDCAAHLVGECTVAPVELVASELALAIVDNAYDGSIASMTCVDFDVPAGAVPAYVTQANVDLVLAIDHPWAGDLVVKLVGPSGASATYLHRAGRVDAADDGAGDGGAHADVASTHPIVIRGSASGVAAAEALGRGLAGTQTACLDDGVCTFTADPGPATNDMKDEVWGGAWRVCIGDAGLGDQGTVERVELHVVPRPIPTAAVGYDFPEGGQLAIPDGTFDGTLASMACAELPLGDALGRVTLASARLTMEHPAVGELVVAAVDPSGRIYSIVSRPGVEEDARGAADGPGSVASLPSTATVLFSAVPIDAPLPSAEQLGMVEGASADVACAAGESCSYLASAGGPEWPAFAAALDTEAAGTWRLCFGDAVPGNAGAMTSAFLILSRGP